MDDLKREILPFIALMLAGCLIACPIIADDEVNDRHDRRIKEGLEVKNPIEEKRVKEVTPNEAYRFFSGNTGPLNTHPALYAGSGKLIVVGYEYYREFPTRELDKAIIAYKELLRLDGYLDSEH